MIKINSPYQFFYDLAGNNLENGSIYIGTANTDPRNNPITVYWDAAGTIPAQQPLRTIGGVITRAGTPSNIYTASDYSLSVYDSDNVFLYNVPSWVATEGYEVQGTTLTADASGYVTIPILGDWFYVIGSPIYATITRFVGTGSPKGRQITVTFTTATHLKKEINSFYPPNEVNSWRTNAGDQAIFIYDNLGFWRCVAYQAADYNIGLSTQGFVNKIRNPNFAIPTQGLTGSYNTSASLCASGWWLMGDAVGAGGSWVIDSSVPFFNNLPYLKVDNTSSKNFSLYQNIESHQARDLFSYNYVDVGNAQAMFSAYIVAQSGALSFTITISTANVKDNFSAVTLWTTYTYSNSGYMQFVFPLNSSFANGCQIKISFTGGGGYSSQDIWSINNADLRKCTNVPLTTTANLYVIPNITKMEPEIRPLGLEAAICARYYQSGKYYWRGHTLNGANHGGVVSFDVPMRIAPTVVTANSGTPTNFASVASTTANVSTNEFEIYRAANSTGGGNFADTWTANAELV